MKRCTLLSLGVLLTCWRASAAPLAYEGFDYINNTAITGQNGGSGWGGPWTTSTSPGSVVGVPGLTYTDANGNSLSVVGNTDTVGSNGAGNFRSVLSSPETPGSTVWLSFEARMTALISNVYAGVSLFNTGSETLFLGDPNNPTTWGIDPKAGAVASGTTPTNTQRFLVYRIDFLPTSAEIRLFEDPLLGVEPVNASATAFATKTSALLWDSIRVQGNQSGFFDEIRIGTTYADVAPVPEPGAAGFLTLAGAGLLGRRRRRPR